MAKLIQLEGEFGVMLGRPFPGSDSLKHFPIPWEGATVPFIPPFSGAKANLSNGYLRYFDNRRRRRLSSVTREAFDEAKEAYVSKLHQLEKSFGHLLSRYDDEVVLKTTCALGMLRPMHFDMDEKGIFGTGRKYQYPKEILEFLYRDLIEKGEKSDETISMKRGTNLGWPTPKGGRSRDEGDALLALHVASVIGARKQGMRLSDTTRFLESWYGPSFAIAGERYQTTERVIPSFYLGGKNVTHNFAQRIRGIYFSPKFMVAWNRRYVKTLLSGIMNHPMHVQDRPALEKRFAHNLRNGRYVFSLDVSRFDQSHGISVVLPILELMSRVCAYFGLGEQATILEDLVTEFTVHDAVPTSRDLFWEEGGQILSSGLSMTSIVGCLCSHCIAYTLAHELSGESWSSVDAGYQDWWDALTWGDDIVFSIDAAKIHRRWDVNDDDSLLVAINKIGQDMELKFAYEPTLKFLGRNYSMLTYRDSPLGYPVGRFLQQQFFPERIKDYPFAELGYIARLQMLDPSVRSEVHKAMKSVWPLTTKWFSLSEAPKVLASLIPEVEKYAERISQLDDVFGVFTHGLDPSDIQLQGDEELFKDLLGLGSVDLTDPSKFLHDNTTRLSNEFMNRVKKLVQGDMNMFHLAVEELARLFGSAAPMSGQLYY